MSLQETHFNYKDSDKLRAKRWRKISHANMNFKMMVILIFGIKKSGVDYSSVMNEHEQVT